MRFIFNKTIAAAVVLVAGILIIFLGAMCAAPRDFPTGVPIVIPSGESVSGTGSILQEEHVIQSKFAFRVAMFLVGDNVHAGTYVFAVPTSVFGVAQHVASGSYGLSPMKITIPEGSSNREIAEIISMRFPGFNSVQFMNLAKEEEGYLFPDTYFFMPDVTPEKVITTMRATFDERIKDAQPQIAASGRSMNDIVIMASILEKEARLTETRRTIADILWRRIKAGMALQVDAVFGYILGRDTFHPTGAEAESVLTIDSPYNTYKYRGLPPGPIGNPGLDAIIAAATPIKNAYVYYLTDAEGVMHYARTFEEHKKNKELYLR